jgi:hypothetical protein
MAPTVIFNNNLIVTKVSQGTDTYSVEIQLKRKRFYVINQYYQYSDSIKDHMSKLCDICLLEQYSILCRHKCEIESIVLFFRIEESNSPGNIIGSWIPSGKWARTVIDFSWIYRPWSQHWHYSTKEDAQK